MTVARRTKKPTKKKSTEKKLRLTLTRNQFAEIHDMLHSVLTSPNLAPIRAKLVGLDVENIVKAREAIKEALSGVGPEYHVTVEETFWVLSRTSWVINEAAGYRLKHINGEVLGNINTQLQRKTNG